MKKSQVMSDANTSASTKKSVLREASFRFYLGATTVSLLGDRIAELVIPYLLITTTGSAFVAGFVGAMEQIPAVLFALWIGVIIDRSSPLKAMLMADFARFALFLAIALLLSWNVHLIWLLALLLFCVGIANVWFRIASGTILPAIVSRERLVSANSSTEAADAAMTLVGPTLGGLIYQIGGTSISLVANALSFLLSGTLLLFVRKSNQEDLSIRPPRKISHQEIFTGLRAVVKIPQLRMVQLALLALNTETSAIVLLLVALSTKELHLSSLKTGIILTSAGIGGLLTSTLLTTYVAQRYWGHVLGGIFVIMAAALVSLAFANSFLVAFVANMVLDGAAALGFIVSGSVRQGLTPDPFLGQISATSSLLNTVIRTISLLLAGTLIMTLGQRPSLMVFALLMAVIGLILALAPSTRSLLSTLTPIPVAALRSEGEENKERGVKKQ